MQNVRGLWLPDGDDEFARIFQSKDGLPLLDGKPTYQHRKYAEAKKHMPGHRRRHAVDVGAHCGLWTRMMVKDFLFTSAFEPVAKFRECWDANMVEARNCLLHPFALGADYGKVNLKIKRGSSGATHIVAESPKQDDVVSATLKPLDAIGLKEVDFIKIDCEGYEWFVIMGGESTIRKYKPVLVVEQKESTKDRYGLPFESAIDLLKHWGATQSYEIGGDHIVWWPD